MATARIKTLKNILLTIIAGAAIIIATAGFLNSNPKDSETLIINLTDNDFESHIKQGIVLVDFWAIWCGPCRIQYPIVKQVAVEMDKKAKVAKLDIDKNTRISSRYAIRNIPTIIIFKNGVPVERFVGVTGKNALLSALNKHLNNK